MEWPYNYFVIHYFLSYSSNFSSFVNIFNFQGEYEHVYCHMFPQKSKLSLHIKNSHYYKIIITAKLAFNLLTTLRSNDSLQPHSTHYTILQNIQKIKFTNFPSELNICTCIQQFFKYFPVTILYYTYIVHTPICIRNRSTSPSPVVTRNSLNERCFTAKRGRGGGHS